MLDLKRLELRRVLRNWREECDSAALYEALAKIEADSRLGRIFGKLAASEREHVAYWEQRLRSMHQAVPRFRPSMRTRMMALLASRLGTAFVIPNITIHELADQRKYAAQEDARAAGLVKGEREHAAVMRRLGTYGRGTGIEPDSTGDRDGASAGQSIVNSLRAAVLGANDGVVSNYCLMVGVAAGGVSASAVLFTGLAGMVAGACSMALGEWLSVTNAREMARSQMDIDARELHTNTEWKLEELVLDVAAAGNDPGRAAAYSFALFALGAMVPVVPYLLVSSPARGSIASSGLSLAALFAIGLVTAFFNGRSALFSGLRQVAIGALAAAVTYCAGHLFGALVQAAQ
jgi:vacuolar iron transporter family protein